jgi:hypothetical protein
MNEKVIDIDGNLGYVVSRVDLNTSKNKNLLARLLDGIIGICKVC